MHLPTLALLLALSALPSSATLSHLPASLADSLRSIGFGGPEEDVIVLESPSPPDSVLSPPRTKFDREKEVVITEELIESVVGEEGVDLLRTLEGGDEKSVIQLLLTEDDQDFHRKLEELVVPVSDMTKEEVIKALEKETEEESNMNGKLNLMGKMEQMKMDSEGEENEDVMVEVGSEEGEGEEVASEEIVPEEVVPEEGEIVPSPAEVVPEGGEVSEVVEGSGEEEIVSEPVDSTVVEEVVDASEGEMMEGGDSTMTDEPPVDPMDPVDPAEPDVVEEDLSASVEEVSSSKDSLESRSDEVETPVTEAPPAATGFFGKLLSGFTG